MIIDHLPHPHPHHYPNQHHHLVGSTCTIWAISSGIEYDATAPTLVYTITMMIKGIKMINPGWGSSNKSSCHNNHYHNVSMLHLRVQLYAWTWSSLTNPLLLFSHEASFVWKHFSIDEIDAETVTQSLLGGISTITIWFSTVNYE